MSLINDMLRNLEAKRPDDLARQNLQKEVRSLPPAPGRKQWVPMVAGALSFAVLGVGVAWLSGMLPARHVEVPPTVAASPAVEPPLVNVPAYARPAAAPVPGSRGDARSPAAKTPPEASSGKSAPLPRPTPAGLAVPDPLPPQSRSVPNVAPESVKALAEGMSAAAKIEKKSVAETPRERADAEYRKAETALAAGRTAEAIGMMQAVLLIDPSHVNVRQALLRQLLAANKTTEAMKGLDEGLALYPGQTAWALSLARLQLEQGDLAAADKTLLRSQAHAENRADYAGFQGHLKARQGQMRQAVALYQRATQLAPGEGRWWLGLGLALDAEGKPHEAREAMQRALASGNLSSELNVVAEQYLR